MYKIFSHLEDLVPVSTAHGEGTKFVFLNNYETDSAITQIAYGKFEPREKCNNHIHPTMEEYFFFLKGAGEYEVGQEIISLKKGVFLRIPPGVKHALRATGTRPLEFFYWGVATD